MIHVITKRLENIMSEIGENENVHIYAIGKGSSIKTMPEMISYFKKLKIEFRNFKSEIPMIEARMKKSDIYELAKQVFIESILPEPNILDKKYVVISDCTLKDLS